MRVEARGRPDRVGLRHRLDRRKHHGAPFFAAAVFPRAALNAAGETASCQGRRFRPRCGSSVFSVSGEEAELHLDALDAPGRFTPTYELRTCRR